MATTIKSGTLKTRVQESIILDGIEQGTSTLNTFSGINSITKRIITITTTESTIATFSAAAASAGHYVAADARYIRFTNKDDANFITLTFRNQDNDEVAIKLDAGQSFIWKQNKFIQDELMEELNENFKRLEGILIKLIDQQKKMQLEQKGIENSYKTLVEIIASLSGNGLKDKFMRLQERNENKKY